VPRVRIHADVLASLEEQLGWIAEHRDDGWAERLREDLDEALDALAEFPWLGAAASPGDRAAAGDDALLRLPLRRTPFVLWYVFDERRREVWVLRLFHGRQSRGLRRRRPRKPDTGRRRT
jgi:plasmid stabilization system protein ParE